MRIGRLFGYLSNRLQELRDCNRGNVVFTFALATLPIIGFVGAAVDYSRGNSAKVAMQAAIDATGLMLSKEAQSLTQVQLAQKANDAFLALFNRPDVTNIVITPTFSSPSAGSFKLVLDVSGKVPTTFTQILGQDHMDLGVTTEVVWGVKRLELALALDVTLSMDQSNKINELKKAAKSLLSTLKKAAKKDGDVKVSIVPFSVHVNADPANRDADWLDWSAWANAPHTVAEWLNHATQGPANQNVWDRTGPGTACPFTTGNHGFACTNGPASASNETTVTTIPSSGTYNGLICPARDNGSKSTSATGDLSNRYRNGCYTSVPRSDSDWYPVRTGSSASCDGQSQCLCSGSGSSKVCAFHPSSNWNSAKGSSASCGNLSTSNPEVCKCFGTGSNKVCKQKAYNHEWRPLPKTAWNGCVRDRNQNYDADDTTPTFASTLESRMNLNGVTETYRMATSPATADAFQPDQFYHCPVPLLPLTYDWSALETKIENLGTVDATNVTIGMIWGYHTLTSTAPIGNAEPTGTPDLDKVIILLTDGLNTQNRWNKFNSGGVTDVDNRMKAACDSIRKAGIKMYTIRVIDGNAKLLQDCATLPGMYYDVQNASDLEGVFTTIADSLANLRLAK